MSPVAIGLVGIALLVFMIFARVPVAVGLGLVGYFGYAAIDGFTRAGLALGGVPIELASAYGMSVIPLFAVMGALITSAGLSADLFRTGNAVFRGVRGSLAMSAIFASAMFGAVSGSSVATAATMSKVSIPEMLGARYTRALSAGAVAAGGTLGILIPPSLILMIYGIISQQSVAMLFAASLIPGLLLTAFYIVVVMILVRLRPDIAPALTDVSQTESRGVVAATFRIWHVAMLFGVTLGGIYFGFFTPTEAAAIGALGALSIGLLTRRMGLRHVRDSFAETARLVASLVLIVMTSTLFSYFIVQTGISRGVIDWVTSLGLSPVQVILLICVFYIVLGCFLEGIGMILITVPIILPLVLAMGFDPIWFGVLLVILVEIGLITPPLGMNIFVIRAVSPEIDTPSIYRGVWPFLIAPLVLIGLLLVFPEIALWLPSRID